MFYVITEGEKKLPEFAGILKHEVSLSLMGIGKQIETHEKI